MSTVARKLSIMRPIPIVNEMATVNVAIATDVLLRELRMLLVATIPSNPNSFPQIGVSSFSENIVDIGTSRALPSTTQSRPMKLIIKLFPGINKIKQLASNRPNPHVLTCGMYLDISDSNVERPKDVPGGTLVASIAGMDDANKVAVIPSIPA